MPARKPLTRKSLATVLVVLAVLAWQHYGPGARPANVSAGRVAGDAVQTAYASRRSGVWLEAQGSVQRLLADDKEGSRHQRFILDTGHGLTVLVAHNIDLAGRVPLAVGDSVVLRGRYEWNERGGVIHWTHHDPQGRDAGGWIRIHATLYR